MSNYSIQVSQCTESTVRYKYWPVVRVQVYTFLYRSTGVKVSTYRYILYVRVPVYTVSPILYEYTVLYKYGIRPTSTSTVRTSIPVRTRTVNLWPYGGGLQPTCTAYSSDEYSTSRHTVLVRTVLVLSVHCRYSKALLVYRY